MTAIKTLAASVIAWSLLATFAEAAPLSWFGGSTGVSSWYANQALANGGFYAPSHASAALSLPVNWFTTPSYISSVSSPAATLEAVSAPAPAPAPSFSAAPMLVPTLSPVTQSASFSNGPQVEAYINMGTGNYAEAGNLTSGGAQAWYNSPSAIQAFGGAPSSSQQSAFTQAVLRDVQQTFQHSGIDLNLTTDPSVAAQHMISVVSGTSYPGNPGAIGITDVGANGFSFIDKLSYASNPTELEWAVAHNVSHELMHALGVAVHADTTGTYLDTGTATWQMLTDPKTKFSPEAIQLIQSAMAGSNGASGSFNGAQQMGRVEGDQLLAQPVPEPCTMALWSVTTVGGLAFVRRRRMSRTS
jgi:hypothetical protein